MVLFNYATKELTAKVVYYGPGLCGKTTNLQWVHEKVPIKNKGKMLSLATETDRTLFFDFLPIELGLIRGMRTRIQLYTVPGQVFYNATRRMVLKGADAVVFVADSQEAMIDANIESLENLLQNLEANEINANEIPMVLQYNKRDLPNALPIEILNERLNERNLPHYEAVAVQGLGVEETLKGVTSLVFRSLAGRYGAAEDRSSPTTAPGGSTPAPPSRSAAVPVAAPVRPVVVSPPPAAVPVRPPTPAAAHPPLNLGQPVRQHEELLDALELHATAESEDSLLVDELDVEEVAFDELPPPVRPSPPRAAAPSRDADPRTTMASTPREAEEIRSRIVQPRRPATLPPMGDARPLGFPPARAVPTVAKPPEVDTIPPVPPAPPAITVPAAASDTSGVAEVTVPITVAVDKGTAQVNVHLRLILKTRGPK